MMNGAETFTTIHFAAMGLLALLAVIAIVAGVRAKRRRVAAQREVEAHAEEAGVEITPEAEPGEQAAEVAPQSPRGDATGVPQERFSGAAPPKHPLADVPIAASVAPDGTTATIAADTDTPASPAPGDEPVTLLKGLGPKVASRLAELGIDRVGQIAALDEADAAALDAELGPFAGRLQRDRWIEQARLLAAGDREGFERMFGKL